MLAHRREIIQQTSAKLRANGISHGIIQAGTDPRPMASVRVASVLTLWMRCVRNKIIPLPSANLLIVDECHHATAMTWRTLIAAYPDAVLIGTTATPCRGDGRGLGGIFTVMLQTPQVAELIEQGYLVKSRVYAPVDPDLKGVRTVAGDYVEDQLAERMDRAKLIGDIVTHWHKYGETGEPSHSRSTSLTRSISVTSSSAPASALNTSTVRRRSPSATRRWRDWPQARPR